MRVSHEQTAPVTPEKAFDRLQAFIAERRSSKEPCGDMECFERELHEHVVAVEREGLAEELARLDVAALRTEETVPPEAVTVAVSLDGVMVPMKDGARTQKRQGAKAQGKHTCGPAGYQEVGCGTLSFYDAEGERLSTAARAHAGEA